MYISIFCYTEMLKIYVEDNFYILDIANNQYELKLKDALHIKWEKPTINKQNKHVYINLSLWVPMMKPFDNVST